MGCNQMKNEDVVELKECHVGLFTHSVNAPEYKEQKDTLTIYSGGRTDFFNAPDGTACTANAPLLLKELDNTRPFTFSVKVKPVFHETYDAGTVYLFHSGQLWQKFAFEMDERKRTRVVTVRTVGTSDDNNHDSIVQDEVYLKISSDTKQVGFYYSVDGKEWQMVRLYRNEYPEKIYVGISSQSPAGNGSEARFSDISFQEGCVQNFRLGI